MEKSLLYAHHQLLLELEHPPYVTPPRHASAPNTLQLLPNPSFRLLGLRENIETLMETHACLIVQGLTRDLSRSTKLINSYGSFCRVDFERLLFDSIPDPGFLRGKR
ncbi:hypothetical protein Peur_005975 [Populus x canadensis]